MTGRGVTESVVEQAALDWLDSLGWAVKHGPEIRRGRCLPTGRTTGRWR